MVLTIPMSLDDILNNAEAPRESSDPLEILARRELALGINLQGVPVDVDVVIRIELKLDLND